MLIYDTYILFVQPKAFGVIPTVSFISYLLNLIISQSKFVFLTTSIFT